MNSKLENDAFNLSAETQKVHDLANLYFDVHTLEINTDDNRFFDVNMTINGRKANTSFSFKELKDWSENGVLENNVSERFQQFKVQMK